MLAGRGAWGAAVMPTSLDDGWMMEFAKGDEDIGGDVEGVYNGLGEAARPANSLLCGRLFSSLQAERTTKI